MSAVHGRTDRPGNSTTTTPRVDKYQTLTTGSTASPPLGLIVSNRNLSSYSNDEDEDEDEDEDQENGDVTMDEVQGMDHGITGVDNGSTPLNVFAGSSGSSTSPTIWPQIDGTTNTSSNIDTPTTTTKTINSINTSTNFDNINNRKRKTSDEPTEEGTDGRGPIIPSTRIDPTLETTATIPMPGLSLISDTMMTDPQSNSMTTDPDSTSMTTHLITIPTPSHTSTHTPMRMSKRARINPIEPTTCDSISTSTSASTSRLDALDPATRDENENGDGDGDSDGIKHGGGTGNNNDENNDKNKINNNGTATVMGKGPTSGHGASFVSIRSGQKGGKSRSFRICRDRLEWPGGGWEWDWEWDWECEGSGCRGVGSGVLIYVRVGVGLDIDVHVHPERTRLGELGLPRTSPNRTTTRPPRTADDVVFPGPGVSTPVKFAQEKSGKSREWTSRDLRALAKATSKAMKAGHVEGYEITPDERRKLMENYPMSLGDLPLHDHVGPIPSSSSTSTSATAATTTSATTRAGYTSTTSDVLAGSSLLDREEGDEHVTEFSLSCLRMSGHIPPFNKTQRRLTGTILRDGEYRWWGSPLGLTGMGQEKRGDSRLMTMLDPSLPPPGARNRSSRRLLATPLTPGHRSTIPSMLVSTCVSLPDAHGLDVFTWIDPVCTHPATRRDVVLGNLPSRCTFPIGRVAGRAGRRTQIGTPSARSNHLGLSPSVTPADTRKSSFGCRTGPVHPRSPALPIVLVDQAGPRDDGEDRRYRDSRSGYQGWDLYRHCRFRPRGADNRVSLRRRYLGSTAATDLVVLSVPVTADRATSSQLPVWVALWEDYTPCKSVYNLMAQFPFVKDSKGIQCWLERIGPTGAWNPFSQTTSVWAGLKQVCKAAERQFGLRLTIDLTNRECSSRLCDMQTGLPKFWVNRGNMPTEFETLSSDDTRTIQMLLPDVLRMPDVEPGPYRATGLSHSLIISGAGTFTYEQGKPHGIALSLYAGHVLLCVKNRRMRLQASLEGVWAPRLIAPGVSIIIPSTTEYCWINLSDTIVQTHDWHSHLLWVPTRRLFSSGVYLADFYRIRGRSNVAGVLIGIVLGLATFEQNSRACGPIGIDSQLEALEAVREIIKALHRNVGDVFYDPRQRVERAAIRILSQ
ncbi:hypothetical protein HD553DRAFT_325488 [Filobasidium floriforme]|uniref:uncharacterized protein n=1 Tax=Filobasidium floriforme TaxID=5210 RepID=UPI001E8E0417|nr:uncharacterized protein HD553DRAFT_325488 [Filobasidium floriforme]KAH8081469.1 hypothetical protein HD553DRAFT_325488 [Filobasidium floriforme]